MRIIRSRKNKGNDNTVKNPNKKIKMSSLMPETLLKTLKFFSFQITKYIYF